jgi:hypothetical protein
MRTRSKRSSLRKAKSKKLKRCKKRSTRIYRETNPPIIVATKCTCGDPVYKDGRCAECYMEIKHGRLSKSVFDSSPGLRRAAYHLDNTIKWLETRESKKELDSGSKIV